MKKQSKIIEYGVYLLAFLLSLQTRWILRYGILRQMNYEYTTISLYAIDFFIVFLVSYFFISVLKGRVKIKKNKYSTTIWSVIGALELIIFVSCFIAPEKAVAFMNYGRFLLGVGIYWILTSIKYDKVKLYYGFIAGIMVQAVIGFLNYITQIGLASKWLGMSLHNPDNLGVSVVETLDGARWLRAYGAMDHPNILGGLLVIGIIFTVYLIMNEKSHGRRTFALYFIGGFLSLVLLMTFSRAAFVALIIGLLVLVIGNYHSKNIFKQKRLVELIVIVFITATVFSIQNKDLVLTRFFGDTRLEVKSNSERMVSLDESKELISDYWLFGTGIGNYGVTIKEKYVPEEAAWYYQPVHNVYLLIFSEIGIFGIVTFLFFLCFTSFVLLKQSFKNKNNFYLLSIMVIILSTFFVDHWWWSLHFGMVFFWFLMGVIYHELDEEDNK